MYKHGYLKVAAATPKIHVGDISHNKQEIINLLNHSQSSIVVFPELTITGYSQAIFFFKRHFYLKQKML
ncbi:hypothetical protein KHQ89_04390 [Mycoplasmatota bacterium]|nr:hypothetical protein KHQ89_04390 [Mycoplasmatota bacterium]